MASSTYYNSTTLTTRNEPWGVDGVPVNVFPESYERTSMPDEIPPPRDAQPSVRAAQDKEMAPVAKRNAFYVQQAVRTALWGDSVAGSSRHPAQDGFSDEVSQGVLRDGRWTVNHPSVMDYINRTKKEHGFSLSINLLDSCPPPEDLRTYALVALRMQAHYNWPVWWALFNTRQKEMTKRVIEMELRISQSISVDYVEEDLDSMINEGHQSMRFTVPGDWLTPQVKALKDLEQQEECAMKRKRDEMEASREENGLSSQPKKRRRNGPRLTLKKKRKAARKAVNSPDDLAAGEDDDETIDIIDEEPAPLEAATEAVNPFGLSVPKNAADAAALPVVEDASNHEPKTLKVANPSRISARLRAKKAQAVEVLPAVEDGSLAPALKVDRPSVATASGSSTAVPGVSGTESTAVASKPRRARRRPAGKVDKQQSTTNWVSGLKAPGELETIEEEQEPVAIEGGKKRKSTKGKGAAKGSTEDSVVPTQDDLEAIPLARRGSKAATSTKSNLKGKGAAECSAEASAAQTENDLEAIPRTRRARKATASTQLTIKIKVPAKTSAEASASQTQEDLEAVPPARRPRKAAAKDEAAEREERQTGKDVVTVSQEASAARSQDNLETMPPTKKEEAARPEEASNPEEEPTPKPAPERSRRTRQKSRKAIEAAESAAQLAAKRRSGSKKVAIAATAKSSK
ncbi:hypothetical protein NEOLEDRAFT_1176130 [Neolentinus lepideus HHB14362 ss-1]|uniref:Uncharacterized protein n=1 Tax=Neolentinus lepideus HHB14362 ss-1 TaxID=1314782 RepID=A0A165UCH8_9AGAM|nr:hypothetical protein NEOLEDRAFT_1176130 [Neolentinus lepideus HHB14362 ss-1]